MKAIILISTLLMGTSSLALAPPLRQATRARGLADELVPIVDDNNNRRQWVATYGEANKTNDGSPDSPTVDDNNNRRQWVATYGEANKTNDGFPESPTVDDNNNRRQWVATYGEANKTENPDSGSTVDYTSNRSDWVVEYKAYDHWLPTGPDYLDLGQLEKGYHAHLLAMQGLLANQVFDRGDRGNLKVDEGFGLFGLPADPTRGIGLAIMLLCL
ncbi:hypothetical protein NPX13_g5405 [Xylaria arbuscula]|uniref:Uncharacterized protein n=1 Tax=Xylaria arbuscula TaxID=114810 RepID=A0A9W8TMF3_9PEZI|nr:hypothetical protein NPX13_g5405 [Xylaria arbuscula]